jgi:predicted ATPase
MTYGIILAREGRANNLIQEEWATWGRDRKELFRRKNQDVTSNAEVRSPGANETLLRHAPAGLPELHAIRSATETWTFYDFQRNKIAERQQVRKETRLSPDGSNTATVLHWVRNEDVDTFSRLEALLKQAIPEVEHLLASPDENGKVYIAFKERHLAGRIPAWNLSKGSVKLVATLLALFVPAPPALVGIEAPESSLHPYLMEYLADILKLGSEETQVLITTHSTYLLDKLPPTSLVLVTKEQGGTRARRTRRSKALKEALETLGLGEMWYAGHLGGTP